MHVVDNRCFSTNKPELVNVLITSTSPSEKWIICHLEQIPEGDVRDRQEKHITKPWQFVHLVARLDSSMLSTLPVTWTTIPKRMIGAAADYSF